jgi:hypothetical protein
MKKAYRTRAAKKLAPRLAGQRGRPRVVKPHVCAFKAKSGKPCGATPLSGKNVCLFHSGDNASQLGARGGRRRAIYHPDGLVEFAPPKTAVDLTALFATSIIEMRSGKLDPRVANSISYLGAGFLKALDLGAHEARLDAIEKHIAGDQG